MTPNKAGLHKSSSPSPLPHAHLETTDVILVSLAGLTEAAAAVTPGTGRTPFTAMADRHIDVTANSAQIALIATLFIEAINAGQCRRMTRRQISNGIAQAVLDGSIAPADLAPWNQKVLTGAGGLALSSGH